jgi:thymidine kinase
MSLDIVIGSMFSGKTTHIYNLIKKYNAIGVSTVVIKHTFDDRYTSSDENISHDGLKVASIMSPTIKDILDVCLRYNVICIDEAQFFPDLYEEVLNLVENHDKIVIIVGLDGDYKRKSMGQILQCIPIADTIRKLTSLCVRCKDGTLGLFSYRHSRSTEQILIGGADDYSPLCRRCYINASGSSS